MQDAVWSGDVAAAGRRSSGTTLLHSSIAIGQRGWHEERLLDRRPHAKARVERLVRILEDQLHAAPQSAQLAAAQSRDVLAAEANRARVGPDEAEDRLRRRSSAPVPVA
jgi:hypothetical protein